jgi:hypothetical protein
MVSRRASCHCGQLQLLCEGEPARVSICHCLACQKRTGSAFGVSARFQREQITSVTGRTAQFVRVGDEGHTLTFHFCPDCGSTVYWEINSNPEIYSVAVGAFADPNFPEPHRAIYESRRHSWVSIKDHDDFEHFD